MSSSVPTVELSFETKEEISGIQREVQNMTVSQQLIPHVTLLTLYTILYTGLQTSFCGIIVDLREVSVMTKTVERASCPLIVANSIVANSTNANYIIYLSQSQLLKMVILFLKRS